MPHDDHELKLLRAHWRVEEPAPSLAGRIIAHARSLPQHQPWPQRLALATAKAFGEWNYAMGYKGAALAAVMVLGMMSGIHTAQSDETDALSPSSYWTEAL